MNRFAPCPSCARHVRVLDRTCPFCGEAQPTMRGPIPVFAKPLSRAAIVFASATAIVACGKTEKDKVVRGGPAPPYGVAPIDEDAAMMTATPVPVMPDEGGIAHGTSDTPHEIRGELEMGAPKMTNGALPNGDRILKGVRPRLRNCYSRGLVKNTSMQGKVTLSVKVAANGEVLESKVTENKGLDSLPAECMAAVIKKVQFDAPGGTGASFTLQLTCSLPDGGAPDGGH